MRIKAHALQVAEHHVYLQYNLGAIIFMMWDMRAESRNRGMETVFAYKRGICWNMLLIVWPQARVLTWKVCGSVREKVVPFCFLENKRSICPAIFNNEI